MTLLYLVSSVFFPICFPLLSLNKFFSAICHLAAKRSSISINGLQNNISVLQVEDEEWKNICHILVLYRINSASPGFQQCMV